MAFKDFELKWAREIIGIDGDKFLLQFKCGEVRGISFLEAKSNWPNLMITFCQKCLDWIASPGPSSAIEETTNSIVSDFDEVVCK